MNADDVKELLDYDRATGEFYWRPRPRQRFKHSLVGKRAGTINWSGYVVIRLNGKYVRAHQLVWLMEHGVWPKGEIDHINRNPTDNRIENLRDTTKSQNLRNTRTRTDSSTGITGVCFHKAAGKWWVYISIETNQRVSLGLTDDLFEAACIRKSAENQHGYNARAA